MPELNFNVLARQGPSGVLQGFEQGQELRNQMVRQKQQEQLADLQMQNALREQRMAGEEEAAYKAAGSDMGRLQQELMQRGLGKQSMAVGAQLAKQQTDKMAMLEQQHKLIKSAAAQVFANPENAIQTLTAFGQRTGIDMSDDLAQIQAIVNDPAKIKQWAAGIAIEADKLLPKFQQFDQGGAVITGAVDPLTGQFRQGTAYQKSMAPGEAERIAISRGQLGVAQGQLDLARQKERRVADQGESVEISPKEIQKREAAFPKATSAVKSFEANSESFVKDLEALRNHPGLSNITGVIAGRTPSFTREGRAAQALYDKIVAKGGFQALQSLREASTTGGALGSVSNQEGKQLVQSFAAIDQRQDAPDVQAAIDQVIAEVKGTQARVREAYDMTYEYKGRRGGTAAPAPAPAAPGVPKAGTVQDGYRFKGGNPADPKSWEKL